jgi:hypothetical protein
MATIQETNHRIKITSVAYVGPSSLTAPLRHENYPLSVVSSEKGCRSATCVVNYQPVAASPLEICTYKATVTYNKTSLKDKSKVVPVFCFFFFYLGNTPWRRIWELKCNSTHSLTSALGRRWRVSFTPTERALGTHWIRGWVGHRAVLDTVVKRKISSPRRESKPRTPTVQPVA